MRFRDVGREKDGQIVNDILKGLTSQERDQFYRATAEDHRMAFRRTRRPWPYSIRSPCERFLFPCFTALNLSFSRFDQPIDVWNLLIRFPPGLRNVKLEGVWTLRDLDPFIPVFSNGELTEYLSRLERYNLANISCRGYTVPDFLQRHEELPGLKELDLSRTGRGGMSLSPELIENFHERRLDITSPEASLRKPLRGRRIVQRNGADSLSKLQEMYPGTEFVMERRSGAVVFSDTIEG